MTTSLAQSETGHCTAHLAATKPIPVIISSAYRQLLDAEEAHLRTQGYVLLDKPYRIEELLAAVQTLLRADHARAVGA